MLSKAKRGEGYRAVPQPTLLQVAILPRIAAGFPLGTYTDEGTRFTYRARTPADGPLPKFTK